MNNYHKYTFFVDNKQHFFYSSCVDVLIYPKFRIRKCEITKEGKITILYQKLGHVAPAFGVNHSSNISFMILPFPMGILN
ncbi:MAG: hypothetical protein ACK46R_00520, partial [Bacteroidota bacterium]